MPQRTPPTKPNIFRPQPPTPLQNFLASPIPFLTKWLYTHQVPICPPPSTSPRIKIVCISDTHNLQLNLPHGDILIHAGDLTVNGTFAELQAQLDWLKSLPHKHKVVIAGNPDLLLDSTYYKQYPRHKLADPATHEAELKKLSWGDVTYLQNSAATCDVRGRSICIYGAPQTPKYGNWAFQYSCESDVWKDTVPERTDILVTHGPAKGHVDADAPASGCMHLLRELWRVKPRLHVCGHIHRARGVEFVDWGTVQWCYDEVSMGNGGVATVLVMLLAWMWAWMAWTLGGKRVGRTVFVNAAVAENLGDGAVVVEM